MCVCVCVCVYLNCDRFYFVGESAETWCGCHLCYTRKTQRSHTERKLCELHFYTHTHYTTLAQPHSSHTPPFTRCETTLIHHIPIPADMYYSLHITHSLVIPLNHTTPPGQTTPLYHTKHPWLKPHLFTTSHYTPLPSCRPWKISS